MTEISRLANSFFKALNTVRMYLLINLKRELD